MANPKRGLLLLTGSPTSKRSIPLRDVLSLIVQFDRSWRSSGDNMKNNYISERQKTFKSVKKEDCYSRSPSMPPPCHPSNQGTSGSGTYFSGSQDDNPDDFFSGGGNDDVADLSVTNLLAFFSFMFDSNWF